MRRAAIWGDIMFDKEDAANTRRLNEVLGTDHRSKPYDMNKAEDLQHALTMTVAAYRDYTHYSLTLDGLADDFDESVEHFATASWINMTLNPDKVDKQIVKCVTSLNKASGCFRDLADRAKENFVFFLRAVLATPPATQKAVLGQAYKIEPEEWSERMEELFEDFIEVEYKPSIPDNWNAFLELLKAQWAAFAV